MKQCKKCGVMVKDDMPICPLCSMVLTGESDGEPEYPDIHQKVELLRKTIQIICYILVVTEVFLMVINYYNYNGVRWSLITGGAIVYLILAITYSFNRRDGHIKKIFVMTVAAIVLMLVIDYVAEGTFGWSLHLGFPCVVLLLDAIIFVCMLINFKNWQSYLLMQIFTLLLSVLYMVFYLTHIVRNPVLPWIALGVSAILFSATVFIGGKKAKSELKRRFYI